MIKVILLIASFFLILPAFSDDDFDDEESPTREVNFKETNTTKKFSINSLKTFKKIDTYFLKPFSVVYGSVSTRNFEKSVLNVFQNYASILYISNNALTGSSDKTFSSAAYTLFNLTAGTLGTVNLSKELELERSKTDASDLLRFYGMPEYVFFIAVIPFTAPDAAGKIIDIGADYYILNISFVITLSIEFLSHRTLDPKVFDIIQGLDEELIYETYKNQKYNYAKYWKFERSFYPYKTFSLKEKFEDSENEFLI